MLSSTSIIKQLVACVLLAIEFFGGKRFLPICLSLFAFCTQLQSETWNKNALSVWGEQSILFFDYCKGRVIFYASSLPPMQYWTCSLIILCQPRAPRLYSTYQLLPRTLGISSHLSNKYSIIYKIHVCDFVVCMLGKCISMSGNNIAWQQLLLMSHLLCLWLRLARWWAFVKLIHKHFHDTQRKHVHA